MTPTEFVAQYYPQAQSVSQSTGLPVNFVLGQSALETGWGSSAAGTLGNNLFGISSQGVPNYYPTAQAGLDAYSNLINSPRYSGVSSVTGQGTGAIAQYLVNAGYNKANPNYVNSVVGTTNMVDNVLSNGVPQPTTVGAAMVPNKTFSQTVSDYWDMAKHYAFSGTIVVLAIVFIVIGLASLALKQEPHETVRRLFT